MFCKKKVEISLLKNVLARTDRILKMDLGSNKTVWRTALISAVRHSRCTRWHYRVQGESAINEEEKVLKEALRFIIIEHPDIPNSELPPANLRGSFSLQEAWRCTPPSLCSNEDKSLPAGGTRFGVITPSIWAGFTQPRIVPHVEEQTSYQVYRCQKVGRIHIVYTLFTHPYIGIG